MPNRDATKPDPKPKTNDEARRRRYEAPRLTKKRSVSRVTLFSGGGVVAGGLTATG